MKNAKSYPFILLLAAFLFNQGIIAQDLVITLTNSTTETFPISNIQSIKFENNTMIKYDLNGTQTVWDIDDIDNYAFDETTDLNEDVSTIHDDLSIFPNPASGQVSIIYKSNINGLVTIDIIDAIGKLIHHVYKGTHQREYKYIWNPSVQPGVYFCRIISENKVVNKPIVIQ